MGPRAATPAHPLEVRKGRAYARIAAGTTLVKLLYFGVRYASLLTLARLLDDRQEIFLLVVALTEASRLLFDFGLESAVISRYTNNAGNVARFRLFTTVVGQVAVCLLAYSIAERHHASIAVALLASSHFSLLMTFGYMQARLQATHNLASLASPLAAAAVLQTGLLLLAHFEVLPANLCVASFESLALLLSLAPYRRHVASPPVDGTTTLSLGGQLKSTFQDIRHLGQSAILAFLYGRLDVWAISSVANTAGMSQYLLTQRLTSGPLMLAATISNSLIPILASQQEASGRGALRSSQLLIMGYISALTANVCVMSTGPLLHAWLRAPYVNHGLLFLQAGVAALQIVNAVHAAQLLATQQAPQLFRVARVNTAVALIAFPAAMWWGQVQAIATALLVTEGAGTVQHLAFYRRQAKVMR